MFRLLHVLLGEDNQINQLVAYRLLKQAGHTIEVAHNERKLLAAGSFDMVLIDGQMPGI